MNFDINWLLIGAALAFALGWLGSRLDLRQWKREQHDSPRAYFKGLNLLLNEQQDKAIDAFIEAVQHDPDTSDLHFALGNLFRRRGEYERAVRVHEHLLNRADLPKADRDRAQHALAQDFMRAGLFDRAEQAYKALEGSAFDTEALLALLALFERSHDWPAAVEMAQKLERTGTGSFSTRIAHYWCEIALAADARKQPNLAEEALAKAREASPTSPRPLVLTGQRAHSGGHPAQALQAWNDLLVSHPQSFNLIARDYAASALACGEHAAALDQLQKLYRRAPTMDLLTAIAMLDPSLPAQRERVLTHLKEQPSLSAAQELLRRAADGEAPLSTVETQSLRDAVGRAAKPLQKYRCAGCGFEAQHYFWQCPGCLNWDSYPPQKLEDN
jgi:lipopolysaccharide biosynthesis regulator YciM